MLGPAFLSVYRHFLSLQAAALLTPGFLGPSSNKGSQQHCGTAVTSSSQAGTEYIPASIVWEQHLDNGRILISTVSSLQELLLIKEVGSGGILPYAHELLGTASVKASAQKDN